VQRGLDTKSTIDYPPNANGASVCLDSETAVEKYTRTLKSSM
jgi:hypothetical protein